MRDKQDTLYAEFAGSVPNVTPEWVWPGILAVAEFARIQATGNRPNSGEFGYPASCQEFQPGPEDSSLRGLLHERHDRARIDAAELIRDYLDCPERTAEAERHVRQVMLE